MSAKFPADPMNKLTRREIVGGLAMLAAAGLAAARKPNHKLDYLGTRKLDDILPSRIGRWNFVGNSGVVVPPSDQLSLALYSQLLTRVYSDGSGPPIMLLIAYSASQNGFLQVHRPEFCYTAAGYELSDFRPHQVGLDPSKSIKVNTLTATREGADEKLLYWVRIGHHTPLSWAQQRLVFAEDNLRRLIPDAALVRVSTPLVNEPAAMTNLDEFVRSMVAATTPEMRRVLVA
jgi:EpsI family protein